MEPVFVERLLYKEIDRLVLRFAYNYRIISDVKKLPGATFSGTLKAWLVNYSPEALEQVEQLCTEAFQNRPAEVAAIVPKEQKPQLPELDEAGRIKVNEFERWMRSRRYSENTIGTYVDALSIFFRYFTGKKSEEITNGDLINFNNDYIIKNKLSSSYQNQVISSVKLYFNKIESKKLAPELLYRPKRPKLLPNVLSKEEVKAVLNSQNNIKHKMMLSLIYACGLRCGELLRLEPEHIDEKRHLLIVKQSKGRKDRIVPLSQKVVELIKVYREAHKPVRFLFEGQTKGMMYDERSLQNVLKAAVEKAQIKKPVTLHWLRHSYATHLLENGTDLRYIQEILGHSSSRTTEIYTHVSNHSIQKIISPFDNL